MLWKSFLVLTIVQSAVLSSHAKLAYEDQKSPGVEYLALKGFKEGHSIWNSIGGSPNGRVYVGVSNHVDQVGMFVYHVQTKKIKYMGELHDIGNLLEHDWQGKIHSIIEYNPNDSCMYFGTDHGVAKGSELCDHPLGHKGSYWFKIDTRTDKLTNLGMVKPLFNVKGLALDPVHNRIYGTTYDQTHFYYYEIDTEKFVDLGRYNTWHTPRMTWTDAWGNGYANGAYGEIHKYEVSSGKFMQTDVYVPSFRGEHFSVLAAAGAAACYSKDRKTAYITTTTGRIFAHHMEENGPGRVEDFGCGIPGIGPEEKVHVGCSDIARKGDKLYYGMGGHGKFVPGFPRGTVAFIELDIKTRKKRVIGTLDSKVMTELTGNGYVDKDGWIYFGGHGQSLYDKAQTTVAPRRAWLVRIKPEDMQYYKTAEWK